ncbi:MAG: sigma-54-dependent Fis family transcriptional regulator [Planctomycetes bacterium]|nr:sigma-54-dependent Fis family transcriptional regulator [Planctomycetota bacterium]
MAGISGIVNYHVSDFGERLLCQIKTLLRKIKSGKSKRRIPKGSVEPASRVIVGGSDVLKRLLDQSRRAARVSDVPVLILGESGTGKQRIAEFIHQQDSKRSQNAFVTVNCAAIVGSLAESELFGHQKGAFTGATQDRQGYFRSADGGTILLDEISELDISLQPKILRVLQEALIRPVGSDKEYSIDVRIIAATHRDLAQRVKGGGFRLDLYQRLKVIELHVPPLRERLEDIPVLFEAFLKKYSSYYPYEVRGVDRAVYEILGQTIGAGNIRELENIVRQTLVFKEEGGRIEVKDLPAALITASAVPDEGVVDIEIPRSTIEALVVGRKRLSEAMDEYERVILNRLVMRDISQTALADRLGITRRTLYNKLEKYKLRP